MSIDFGLQQAKVSAKERREHMLRVVKAVLGSAAATRHFRFRDGLAQHPLGRCVDGSCTRFVAVQQARSARRVVGSERHLSRLIEARRECAATPTNFRAPSIGMLPFCSELFF